MYSQSVYAKSSTEIYLLTKNGLFNQLTFA